MPFGNGLWVRAFRLMLTLSMAVIWYGALDGGRSARVLAGAPAERHVGSAEPPTPGQLDRFFANLRVAQKQIARDGFDPQAVVEATGKDSVRLFEWVRDNTHWVPYHGALRGPAGMLMDRAGNSLDRSLLLAELLRRAGHSVRLARAQLPEALARELLAKVRPAPLAARTASVSAEARNAAITQLAKAHQVDEASLREAAENRSTAAALLRKDIALRLSEQSESLLRMVGQIPQADYAQATAVEAAAMADHWWVQRQEKTAWVDLDPLLPDAKPGAFRLAPKETFPIRVADGAVHLDAKFCQEVEVRVIIERRQGGKLAEEVVLKHTLRPSDLIGQRITLVHLPLQWPRGLDLVKEANSASRLRAELTKLTEWTPMLAVGDRAVKGKTIVTTGETKAGPGMIPGGFSPGGGFGGGLGGGEAAPREKGELTAEWIDYIIRVPGQAARTIRREAFDLLGPSLRASGKAATAKRFPDAPGIPALYFLDQTDIIVQVGRFSPPYVSHLALNGILKQEKLYRYVASNPQANDADHCLALLAEEFLGVSPVAMTVAVSRFAMDSSPAVYLATPNILTFRQGTNFGPQGEALHEGVIDLVANDVAVLPQARADSFRIRLRQGVADTIAEGLPPLTLQPCGNASNLFALARKKGIEPVPVRGVDDAFFKTQGLPADVAIRMRDALAAGYTLVTPRQPLGTGRDARTCWWRVNMRTGETVGVMDTGYNAGAVENVMIRAKVAVRQFVATESATFMADTKLMYFTAGVVGAMGGDAAWDWLEIAWKYVRHQAVREGYQLRMEDEAAGRDPRFPPR